MARIQEILNGLDGYNYPSLPNNVEIHIPEAEKRLRGGLRFFVERFTSRRYKAEWSESNYRPIVEWMENNQGKGLLMAGTCGLGKSLIGIRILPILINDVHKLVVNCYDAQEMNAMPDEVMKRHLISIDDVGTEGTANIYGNKRLVFPEIVDSAEKRGKLLIISTNLNVAELTQKYGERTIDRLRGITKFVPFTGESMRK